MHITHMLERYIHRSLAQNSPYSAQPAPPSASSARTLVSRLSYNAPSPHSIHTEKGIETRVWKAGS